MSIRSERPDGRGTGDIWQHLANVGQISQNEAHGAMGEVLTEGTVDIRMPDDDGPAAKWSTAATLTGLPR